MSKKVKPSVKRKSIAEIKSAEATIRKYEEIKKRYSPGTVCWRYASDKVEKMESVIEGAKARLSRGF